MVRYAKYAATVGAWTVAGVGGPILLSALGFGGEMKVHFANQKALGKRTRRSKVPVAAIAVYADVGAAWCLTRGLGRVEGL